MWSNARMLSRRNLIVVAAFTVFALTVLFTTNRLSVDACPGPFCIDFSGSKQNPSPRPQNADAASTGTGTGSGSTQTLHSASTAVSSTLVDVPKHTASAEPSKALHNDKDCAGFPDMSNIFVVLKTGASEVYNRIPTQLMTNLKCVPNYEIWSDMEQTVAGQKIFDSLTHVLPEIKAHKDFEIYDHQAKCPYNQEECYKSVEKLGEKGWNLDKYKNIHIAEDNWKNHSQFDWFFYIDADTYVSWPTLVQWFKGLDPKKPAYFGSVALLGGFPFGHGGSGYAVSNAGMKKMFEGKANVGNKYDKQVSETCCGDYMFAVAIKEETGLDVQNKFPTINGEKPYTMPFYNNHWCQPIATMHHLGVEEIDELDKFERARGFKSPTLIKDVFYDLVRPKLRDHMDNWDNLSNDDYYFDEASRKFDKDEMAKHKTGDDLSEAERYAHASYEHCRAACESMPACVQYTFGKGICSTSTAVRFGKPAVVGNDEYWNQKSGFMVQRIDEFAKKHDECTVKFPEIEYQ